MNCTSWKSSWMKRREASRKVQEASRKETSEYRQMSSNAYGNFSFILQLGSRMLRTVKTLNKHAVLFTLFLREQAGFVSFGTNWRAEVDDEPQNLFSQQNSTGRPVLRYGLPSYTKTHLLDFCCSIKDTQAFKHQQAFPAC